MEIQLSRGIGVIQQAILLCLEPSRRAHLKSGVYDLKDVLAYLSVRLDDGEKQSARHFAIASPELHLVLSVEEF